jgi:hypothetical protein
LFLLIWKDFFSFSSIKSFYFSLIEYCGSCFLKFWHNNFIPLMFLLFFVVPRTERCQTLILLNSFFSDSLRYHLFTDIYHSW